MLRLTIGKARGLVKRELGVSAAALEKTPGMNGNPNYPWYSMQTGNLFVEVYTKENQDGKLVTLHLSFHDGLGSITRFFYADTLEEAPEMTELNQWRDLHDLVEEKSPEQIVSTVNRLSNVARKAG